mmetsp:Transcript_23613/g.28508  ORF Transcript_23613/g.28508 Transcript_23613/m.28508 type:complete len:90 (-) Transcript_23613:14-283(-)
MKLGIATPLCQERLCARVRSFGHVMLVDKQQLLNHIVGGMLDRKGFGKSSRPKASQSTCVGAVVDLKDQNMKLFSVLIQFVVQDVDNYR